MFDKLIEMQKGDVQNGQSQVHNSPLHFGIHRNHGSVSTHFYSQSSLTSNLLDKEPI